MAQVTWGMADRTVPPRWAPGTNPVDDALPDLSGVGSRARFRPSFRHLAHLTGPWGPVEHAEFDRPRADHGVCTDDAGRLLGLATRYPLDPHSAFLARASLAFLERAATDDGQFRLRCGAAGGWTFDPPSDDATGRAIHGLGVAVSCAPWPEVRDRARVLFERTRGFRSPHRRATAHASLGAVEVLDAEWDLPDVQPMVKASLRILDGCWSDEWRWPEPALSYGNALLAEAQLAAAVALDDGDAKVRALAALDWLVETEMQDGRFSFTPVGGRRDGDRRPAFDQQPIEAWAMVDACARAYEATGVRLWWVRADRAVDWFFGANDVGVDMVDHVTGGGYDGLEPEGVNLNMGAESSLAVVGALLRFAEISF